MAVLPLFPVNPGPPMACTALPLALFKLTVPALTVTPRLLSSEVPLIAHVPVPALVTMLLPLFTAPAWAELPVVSVRPDGTVHVWLAATAMVPQLRVKPTVAPPMFMPLLRVNVVLPLMVTGADGLAMVMPFQVTALPNVPVQLAGVDTTEFQMALSPLPGAVPLTQLPPDCRAVLLFGLV